MKKLFILLILALFSQNANSESRQKIVVVDTGIKYSIHNKSYFCRGGLLNAVPNTYSPFTMASSHGSNIVDLIGSRIDVSKYCIVSIRAYNNKIQSTGYIAGLRMAQSLKNVVAVNLSISSAKSPDKFMQSELNIISQLLKSNIKVIISAGNLNLKLTPNNCKVYPVCLKSVHLNNPNFIVVGSNTSRSNHSTFFKMFYRDGNRRGFPKMSGTSQSAAIFTGELFKD